MAVIQPANKIYIKWLKLSSDTGYRRRKILTSEVDPRTERVKY